ncbi:hypothetical protein [Fodinicola acaciae]|uniref:hypothetical protein n=1 Tax=Fodinicola acaciae TaxID=2681555 RepID=UPI0013D20F69|nr:hypothetical protein [Fodinicola acaciae]
MRTSPRTKVLMWLGFGVVFGLGPLLIAIYRDGVVPGADKLHQPAISELLIIGAVIAAGAMGELFVLLLPPFKQSENERAAGFTVLAGFSTLLTFGADLIGYVFAPWASPFAITLTSLTCFPLTLLASGVLIRMAARD